MIYQYYTSTILVVYGMPSLVPRPARRFGCTARGPGNEAMVCPPCHVVHVLTQWYHAYGMLTLSLLTDMSSLVPRLLLSFLVAYSTKSWERGMWALNSRVLGSMCPYQE